MFHGGKQGTSQVRGDSAALATSHTREECLSQGARGGGRSKLTNRQTGSRPTPRGHQAHLPKSCDQTPSSGMAPRVAVQGQPGLGLPRAALDPARQGGQPRQLRTSPWPRRPDHGVRRDCGLAVCARPHSAGPREAQRCQPHRCRIPSRHLPLRPSSPHCPPPSSSCGFRNLCSVVNRRSITHNVTKRRGCVSSLSERLQPRCSRSSGSPSRGHTPPGRRARASHAGPSRSPACPRLLPALPAFREPTSFLRCATEPRSACTSLGPS